MKALNEEILKELTERFGEEQLFSLAADIITTVTEFETVVVTDGGMLMFATAEAAERLMEEAEEMGIDTSYDGKDEIKH